MGNPLLDILSTVNIEFIKKFNLKENDAILAEEKHMSIYEELINNHKVQYVPGGATQNAIKVAQWILKDRYKSVYTGCIKDDNYGKILTESCEQIGVRTLYQYNQGSEPTGICASLITGQNRSMVTSLGSCSKFTADHLDRPDVWKFVEQSSIFYISSFFITSCQDALIKVAKHSLDNNKTFCLNLGAEFLVEFFHAQMLEAIQYADIVFGNEAEALKLSAMCKFDCTDVPQIAVLLSEMPFKKPGKHRTVVITQGSSPVIVVHGGQRKYYEVEKMKDELIVDTTGAGDAFVGGFLAQLLLQRSMGECIRCGIWASALVIQRFGCTFPDECLFA